MLPTLRMHSESKVQTRLSKEGILRGCGVVTVPCTTIGHLQYGGSSRDSLGVDIVQHQAVPGQSRVDCMQRPQSVLNALNTRCPRPNGPSMANVTPHHQACSTDEFLAAIVKIQMFPSQTHATEYTNDPAIHIPDDGPKKAAASCWCNLGFRTLAGILTAPLRSLRKAERQARSAMGQRSGTPNYPRNSEIQKLAIETSNSWFYSVDDGANCRVVDVACLRRFLVFGRPGRDEKTRLVPRRLKPKPCLALA
ncbi:hypothetical protein P154DRAFT_258710 [Amniculicola lignicola CBS 123094]|uniref:Uncharacterized protein n=1 Tax=Amniculicola lignicola CBS 123094 TaxID=1392246 RepID=A0A6A5WX61_9PLEO|nr:hypothetical protein P154DRAFT_258710 [Amniculicola lignicola CBS 123094]